MRPREMVFMRARSGMGGASCVGNRAPGLDGVIPTTRTNKQVSAELKPWQKGLLLIALRTILRAGRAPGGFQEGIPAHITLAQPRGETARAQQ